MTIIGIALLILGILFIVAASDRNILTGKIRALCLITSIAALLIGAGLLLYFDEPHELIPHLSQSKPSIPESNSTFQDVLPVGQEKPKIGSESGAAQEDVTLAPPTERPAGASLTRGAANRHRGEITPPVPRGASTDLPNIEAILTPLPDTYEKYKLQGKTIKIRVWFNNNLWQEVNKTIRSKDDMNVRVVFPRSQYLKVRWVVDGVEIPYGVSLQIQSLQGTVKQLGVHQ